MKISTWLLAMLVTAACGKTSTSTPENTGSGTTTTTTTTTGSSAAKPVESPDAGATGSAGSGAASDDVFDRSIVKLDDLKTRMCACKDTTCSATVFDEYKTWRMDMRRAIAGKKPTKAQEDRGNVLDKELTTCRKNVEAGVTNLPPGVGSGSGALDKALVEFEGFKTKMCACKDKACADKVQEDIKTWDRMMRAAIKDKPDADQQARGRMLEKEIGECRKQAEAATPGGGGADAGGKIDAMLVKMGAFKDRVCACKDKACLEAVDKEMTAWMTDAAKGLADAKPSRDQDARADKLQAEMKACVQKLK